MLKSGYGIVKTAALLAATSLEQILYLPSLAYFFKVYR
jgi:hypothetical protein